MGAKWLEMMMSEKRDKEKDRAFRHQHGSDSREEICKIMKKKLSVLLFFFFKQKQAYEILTCDWSSDVCSSDLSSNVFLFGTFSS